MITGSLEKLRQLSFGLFVGLLVVFLGLAFFFDVKKYITRPDEAFVMEGTYIRVLRNNKVRWEAWTDRIAVSRDGAMHTLENINKGYYYREGRPPFEFHAKSGTYNSSTEEVHLEGGLEFNSENGDYFRAEKLDWFGKPEKLTIPVPVVMKLDGNTYHAGEMEAVGEDLKNVVFRKNVVVEIPDAEESAAEEDKAEIEESGVDKRYLKKLVLTADRVEYEGEPKRVLRCYPERDWGMIHVPGEPVMLPAPAGGAGSAMIHVPGEEGLMPSATGSLEDMMIHVPESPAAGGGKVVLEGESFIMQAFEMTLDMNGKVAHVLGEVWILRKAEPEPDPGLSRISRALRKRDTTIEAGEAYDYWKEGYVRIPGPLKMSQENLELKAGRGFMDTKRDSIYLEDGVEVHQEDGSWIVEEGLLDEDAGEEKKESVKEKTDVKCEMLDVNFETEDMSARGDVQMLQEKKKLYGTAAVYESARGLWTVYGNPMYEDVDDGRITADTFLYYQDDGIFQTLGETLAEGDIGKEREEDVKEFYRERDGADPLLGGNRRAALFSRDLRYDENLDTAYANRGARIVFRDLRITADRAVVDNANDTASGSGHVILTDPYTRITADRIYIDGEKDQVELYGNVFMQDFGHPETKDREKTDPFTMLADTFRYDRRKETGIATGSVTLKSGDGSRWVTADALDADRGNQVFVFTGNVRFHQDRGEWLETKGFLDKEDDRARAVAKKPTDITCRRAVIDDGQDTARFEGEVTIVQPEKLMKADVVEADSRAKRFSAAGNVYLEQTGGGWLFEDGFVDEDEDEEVKEHLRKPIRVTAAGLESMYGEKKLLLFGGVEIHEGRNSAKAQKLWHYGETKRTIMEGAVDVKDDEGRTTRAERLVYDGEKKILEAFKSIRGKSELEFEEE